MTAPIECPRCQAPPDEPCRSKHGRRTAQHIARSKAMAKAGPPWEAPANPEAPPAEIRPGVPPDRITCQHGKEGNEAWACSLCFLEFRRSVLGNEERERPPPYLSPTQVTMLQECPLKWYRRYVLGHPEPDRPWYAKGHACHTALEWAAKHVLNGRPWPADGAMRRELILEELDHAGEPVEAQKEARAILVKAGPSIDLSHVVAVERPIKREIDTTAGAVPVQAYIDREDEVAYPWAKLRRVIDYKAGSWIKSLAELQEDPQVLLYMLDAHDRGGAEVAGQWIYLQHQKRVDIEWSPDLDGRARKVFGDAWQQRERRLHDDKWPGKPPHPCGRCGYRASCPALADWLDKAEVPEANPDNLEAVGAARLQAVAMLDIAKGRKSDLDRILREALDDTGGKLQLECGSFWLGKSTSRGWPDASGAIAEIASAAGLGADQVACAISEISESKLVSWLATLEARDQERARAAADATTSEWPRSWVSGRAKA